MRYVKHTGEDVYILPQEKRNVPSMTTPTQEEERIHHA